MSSSTNLWVLLGLGLTGTLLMTRWLKRAIKQDFGAFVEQLELLPPPQPIPPKAPHLLIGLSFAVADMQLLRGWGSWKSKNENWIKRRLGILTGIVIGNPVQFWSWLHHHYI